MRTFHSLSLCLLPTVAGVLLSPVAHADNEPVFSRGGNAAAATHDDTDAWQRASRYPKIHWTARIGSGTAALPESPDDTFQDDTHAGTTPVRHSEPHWTSLIGTGTVANGPPVD